MSHSLGFPPDPALASVLFFFLPWFVYWDIIWGKWVSDDINGIWLTPDAKRPYDGTLQKPLSWHNIFKKFRYELGKKPNDDHDWQRKNQPPFLADHRAHHRFNLWVFGGVLVLFYWFLLRFISPTHAFLATMLFAAHPLGCQAVGWISGVGYVVSAFFMLLGFNVVGLIGDFGWMATPLGTLGSLALYAFCQWMAVEAHFATIGAVFVLAWMHAWPFAIIAGCLSVYQGLHTLRSALALRFKTFKEQNMGQTLSLHWRKLLVVLKTFYYNTVKLAIFPKRIGLYHTFHYHYELPYAETEDWTLWAGLMLAIGSVVLFLLGSSAVQLGLIWFLAFMVIFLNWVTANQFVVDRYVWLPSAGMCVLAAVVLPSWAVLILFGIALMRTWAHIPTYFDELFFYQSNIWNFPDSEIAYGNYGVAQMQRGMIASSMDSWVTSATINPEFDVPWFNMASRIRERGMPNIQYFPTFYQLLPQGTWEKLCQEPQVAHLHLSRLLTQRALACRTCHFTEMLKDSIKAIDQELTYIKNPPPPPKLVRPYAFSTS